MSVQVVGEQSTLSSGNIGIAMADWTRMAMELKIRRRPGLGGGIGCYALLLDVELCCFCVRCEMGAQRPQLVSYTHSHAYRNVQTCTLHPAYLITLAKRMHVIYRSNAISP